MDNSKSSFKEDSSLQQLDVTDLQCNIAEAGGIIREDGVVDNHLKSVQKYSKLPREYQIGTEVTKELTILTLATHRFRVSRNIRKNDGITHSSCCEATHNVSLLVPVHVSLLKPVSRYEICCNSCAYFTRKKIIRNNDIEDYKFIHLKQQNGSINFELMAAEWSKLCSANNYIYYKTPEQLSSYYNIIEDRKKYRDTVAFNIEASRSIRSLSQNVQRYKEKVPAKKYRCIESVNYIIPTPAPTIFPIVNEVIPRLLMPAITPPPITTITTLTESTITVDETNPVRTTRAPRKCQLCQRTSPDCKGSSKHIYCQFKCGICASIDCPARYDNANQGIRIEL